MNQFIVVVKSKVTIQNIQRAHFKVLSRCMHSIESSRSRAMKTNFTKYSHVVSNRACNLTIMRKVCQTIISSSKSVNDAMKFMLNDLEDSISSWQFRKSCNEQTLYNIIFDFLTISYECLRIWRLRSRIHIEDVKLDFR